MSQTHKVGKTATTVTRYFTGELSVVYHRTEVVHVSGDGSIITLNNGGWRTNTTKLRMNQAANQYGLGYQVYQKDFSWFVSIANPRYTSGGSEPYWLPNAIPFTDYSITFNLADYQREAA